MPRLIVAAALSLGACEAAPAATPPPCRAHADGPGNLVAIETAGELIPLRTELRVPSPGWGSVASSAAGYPVTVARPADPLRPVWRGSLLDGAGQNLFYTQSLVATGDCVDVKVSVDVAPGTSLPGAYLFVYVPVDRFAGGRAALGTNATVALPVEVPVEPHLLTNEADTAEFRSADGRTTLRFEVGARRRLTVQDTRAWGDASYSFFVPLDPVETQGSTARAGTLRIRVAHRPVTNDVVVAVGRGPRRYGYAGVGGNFCFEVDSPVTRYALDTLRVAWARTQMSLEEWEPENDDDQPGHVFWDVLKAHDLPRTPLRKEFEFARELQRRGIPWCVSTWYFPPWMYDIRLPSREACGHRVFEERWPEVVESIVTYLVYARDAYGLEPGLFSLNEPDVGVHVALDAAEYPRFVRKLGGAFAAANLRTRILLGDAAAPHNLDWVGPAAADRAALRTAGALGVHTWNTDDPAAFQPWHELADRLRLPLLIAEFGTDTTSWTTPWVLESREYALREAALMQGLLANCQPSSVLVWQFTGNYAVAGRTRGGGITPFFRHTVFRHFANLTPPASDILPAPSTGPGVTATAFLTRDNRFALHVLNLGAARSVSITGLPRSVRQLYPVVSDETRTFATLAPVTVERHGARIEMPSLALLTLVSDPPTP